MNLFKTSSFLLLILMLSGSSCVGQSSDAIISREVQNLTAFSRVYGYVKYFHPSDEAREIDWDKLAILGIETVKKAKTERELKEALEALFLPIAPTIMLTKTEPDSNAFLATYAERIDRDTTGLKAVAWQHLGVDLDNKSQFYTSSRTNREDEADKSSNLIFQAYPVVGETTIRRLATGLWVEVPLALYSDEAHTLPRSSEANLSDLKKELETIDLDSKTDHNKNIWLADIIITWNELQHFYPYFNVIDTDWNKQLSIALKGALEDDTHKDFYATLSRMLATTRDGHIRLHSPYEEAGLPFMVDWIENKVVVTHSLYKQVQPGDIVTSVDGKDAMKIIQDQRKHISGSPQLTLFRSLRQFGAGASGTEAVVKIKRGKGNTTYTIPRSSRHSNSKIDKNHLPVTGQIEDGIYYVDLDRASMSRINDEMAQIAKSPGVIFDLRGYPEESITQLLSHLLTQQDTSDQWLQIPQIVYPDQKNIVGYQKLGWNLTPAKPHIQGDVVFITDARAISYAETVMSFIEHYDLGKIVGQPTAGTNGSINMMVLPGDIAFGWTGTKVLKHDGSQHHLIGIQPTIPVEKTIQGIRERKDEFLEKAIEVLQ